MQEEFDARVASLDAWLETQLAHFAARTKILGESIKDLSALSGALGGAIDALRQQSEPLRRQRWLGAVSDLAGMSNSVASGGARPSADMIKALTLDLGGGQDFFSTFEEYALASGKALNDVADLKGVTDTQLSIDEKQLEALERAEQNARDNHERMMKRLEDDRAAQQAQLDAQHQDTMDRLEATYQAALEQVNVLRGIDTTVATVEQAVASMKEVIQAELEALRAADHIKAEQMVAALEAIATSNKLMLDIERRAELEDAAAACDRSVEGERRGIGAGGEEAAILRGDDHAVIHCERRVVFECGRGKAPDGLVDGRP
jgi:hypothetical protein